MGTNESALSPWSSFVALKSERGAGISNLQKRKGISWGIKFDIDSELPVSMKQTKASLHGMGLANVKREVEKYMGDMKIRVRNDELL